MVISRREAEGAATFNFQRNDATTLRVSSRSNGLPHLDAPAQRSCNHERSAGAFKNRMAFAPWQDIVASLRRRVEK
ncbi:MAG TPA: hypothetical protein VEW26_13050 [Allosphingosinicella sp.]|nr:hypothetical protein [Allosphingosinicella sp.]